MNKSATGEPTGHANVPVGLPVAASAEEPAGPFDSFGRFLGFLAFAVPAVLIFGSLVLLPMYKNKVMKQYQANCQTAREKQTSDILDARSRVIGDVSNDEVYNERLIMSQTSMVPANMKEVDLPGLPPSNPSMVYAPRLKLPDRPAGDSYNFLGIEIRPLRLADKLENPTTRRGLILVMIGAVIASVFLFGPPATAKRS